MFRLKSLIPIVVLVLLASCTNDNRSRSRTESVGMAQPDPTKMKIRSFWDNYREAQKFRTEGRWDSAAYYYSEALEIDPGHEDAWFNLGNMHLELGHYDKARYCWKQIVKVNPNSARAHMQLGRLYMSYERPEVFNIDSARVELLNTSEINKIVTGPLMLLGHIALIEGDFKMATSYFRSVIGSDTKNAEAYFLLGYLAWKENHFDKCVEIFNRAIELSSPDKKIKGVLSEGDTRKEASHLRPINESIFYRYIKDLNQVEVRYDSESGEIEKKYKAMDSLVVAIRDKQISNKDQAF